MSTTGKKRKLQQNKSIKHAKQEAQLKEQLKKIELDEKEGSETDPQELYEGFKSFGNHGLSIYHANQYDVDLDYFMFSIKNNLRNVTKFCTYEHRNLVENRGPGTWNFGSTSFACKSPRWCYVTDTSNMFMIPRLLQNVSCTTSSGYKLLHNSSFYGFAQKMEKALYSYMDDYTKKQPSLGKAYRDTYEHAKEIIPHELRVADTGFTQFAILGNECNGVTEMHQDLDDMYQVVMYLTKTQFKVGNDSHELTTGGNIVVYEKVGGESVRYEYRPRNGTILVGHFDELIYGSTPWSGPRFTLNFYLSKQIYSHFSTHGSFIYDVWKKHGFPKMYQNKKVVVTVDVENNTTKLRYQVKDKFVDNIVHCKKLKSERRQRYGYVDLDGKKFTSNIPQRSCIQDAIINASWQLNCPIKKKTYTMKFLL